jgi:broad specificity phosphatase PhoE
MAAFRFWSGLWIDGREDWSQMSYLYLLRHGQASANSADYDQLSALGHEQCTLLGKALWNRDIEAVYVGPRKRHMQSYEAACQERWPMAIQAKWLDEFPAFELVGQGLMSLLAIEPDMGRSISGLQREGTGGASFMEVLKKATQHWIDGRLVIEGVESYEEYDARMTQAVHTLTRPRDEVVVAFTSAGFISSFVGKVLQADPWLSLRSAWAMHNASATIFRLTDEGPILAAMNWVEAVPKEKRSFI